jgi:predicted short-subunit dehydrogenase-like oxidoreductase (DUF2520 family)
MTARTPNTFVIGAGPVGTTLAGALRLGGVPVLGVWARRPEAARTAGAVAGVAAFSAAPPDLLLESDVVIVAVRDDAIASVADMLVNTGLITTNHVMMHCSGAISADVAFAGVRDRVGGIATMHPLRAIPDASTAMRPLAGTVFGVEGDDRGRAASLQLVSAVGGAALELSGEQMAAYHTAAAMASNYVVALIDAAANVLATAGIERADAVAALVPLARGSLDNVAARGVVGGLTGPIKRGDRDTVGRHLAALAATPELDALYRALGQRTVALARQAADADSADLDAIEGQLGTSATDSQSDVESRAQGA